MEETIQSYVNPGNFFNKLKSIGISFYTGVPDSLLKEICAYITDNSIDNNHIISANEGNAIGVATGYHLATKKYPVVYLQNSGFGNIINPLTSLTDKNVYKIPMIILVGWRGEPGKKDQPQHKSMGLIQEKLLNTLNLKYEILPDNDLDSYKAIDRATKYMEEYSQPYIFLVRKNTFSKYEIKLDSNNNYKFKREQILNFIMKQVNDRDIIVSTTGMLSRELYEYRYNNKQPIKDFLTVGCMGHCSSIGLGLSLEKENNILVLDGDGSMIMHMGALAINGYNSKSNFKHIIINNGAHDSVGGQETEGFNINMNLIAKGCGYNVINCDDYNDEKHIKLSVTKLLEETGPVFLELRCCKGSRNDLGRPPPAIENKKIFMEYIDKA